jgi:hypothetical protein
VSTRRWGEDHPRPPGLLARYPFLRETQSDNPQQRTAWNVRDAQATLILVSGGIDASPGTQFTLTCASLVFPQSHLLLDLEDGAAEPKAAAWLGEILKPPLGLNVAGPRESDVPGIYARAAHFLKRLLVDVR